MGQKVHPKVFRLGTIYTTSSKWFAKKNFRQFLKEDVQIRRFLKVKLREAGVGKIEIERSAQSMNVIIHSAKPGIIIGRGGSDIESLKKEVIQKYLGSRKIKLNISIQEIQKPELDAQVVVQQVIDQIEKRMPFRRLMKRTIENVKKAGAKGVKVMISGRLDGAEIARSEKLTSGSLPLHTMRADIDYARGAAMTTYGTIGVKVWIYKGEVFAGEGEMAPKPVNQSKSQQPRARKYAKP